MKRLKLFLCLFVGLFCVNPAQTIEVLGKGELYKPPFDHMIVMDKYTFGKYHYTAEKYDTLKKEIAVLDSLITEKEITQEILIKDYERALTAKEKEAETYKTGYTDLGTTLNSSIEKNNQLLLDYKKLDDKRKKTKRWRNVFFGSSICSIGILILIIAL